MSFLSDKIVHHFEQYVETFLTNGDVQLLNPFILPPPIFFAFRDMKKNKLSEITIGTIHALINFRLDFGDIYLM